MYATARAGPALGSTRVPARDRIGSDRIGSGWCIYIDLRSGLDLNQKFKIHEKLDKTLFNGTVREKMPFFQGKSFFKP